MSTSTETPFQPLTGRCRCEQVRFRLQTEPMITHCCHCTLCQRSSGSAFGIVAMIETEHLTVVAGKTRPFQGLNNHKQQQCPACGCALWIHRADLGDGVALVGLGTLDNPERLQPEAHYYTRSKLPWLTLPPGVPAFETVGDPGKAGFRERIMAVLALRD